VLAVSCSVYDASLRDSGPVADTGGGGMLGSSGHSGTAGMATNAGASQGGSAGKPAEDAGAGGMSDVAGEVETGGTGGGIATGGGGTSAGTAGTAGTPGTAGSAATGGGGGTAGSGTAGGGGTAGGAGTAAGTGGSAGAAAGAGGGTTTATGCAKLSVPIDAATDTSHFVISLTSLADLSSAVITMRVYVQAGVGGQFFSYIQDGSYHFFGMTAHPTLQSMSGTWTNVVWNAGAQPDSESTNIVKTSVKRIGIEINGTAATTWSNPTVVYVDSITVATPTVNLSFPLDAMSAISTTPTNTDVAGQVMWLNNGSSDTKATGVTIAWQATCP